VSHTQKYKSIINVLCIYYYYYYYYIQVVNLKFKNSVIYISLSYIYNNFPFIIFFLFIN